MLKALFGAVIACLLLAFYVCLVWIAISVVGCQTTGCQQAGFNKNMAWALALIGGLVSALVVAELAITKPGEAPLARVFTRSTGPPKIVKILTVGYLLVWILAGFAAFWVGLRYEDAHQPLLDLGQSWLGLTVAAAYAYFGIKP